MRLSNKVALITGAGSGIGRETAVQFVRDGAKVLACDINYDAAVETVSFCHAVHPSSAEATYMDVGCMPTILDAISGVIRLWGGVDILVNNAGIVRDAQLHKMLEHDFDSVINVNLKGVYNCTRAVVDMMRLQGSGVILTTSSIVGVCGNFGQTNYAAAKAGVIGMTKTWARELGPKGIRANAVCPGFIDTEMLKSVPEKVIEKMIEKVPLKRLGTPVDIANVFSFLASDDAAYINGAVIEVTGGLSL